MPTRDHLFAAYRRDFGQEPDVIAHAPGRVNLMGEHTDYNGGFVFPAAINFGTHVAAGRRDDTLVRATALDFGGQDNEFDLGNINVDHHQGWSNYIRGVLKILQEQHKVGGANLMITGNVPLGAGLSSSASLEIAVLKAFVELYQLPLTGVEAALIGQRAEHEFAGCSCGIMDQLVSAMGRRGHALLLDCQSLAFEHQPISPDYQIVIVNSNVKRGLVDSEYNLRRQQCEQAAQVLKMPSLRGVDLDRLEASRSAMPEVVFRRARHVVTENERTLAMSRALAASEYALISSLMAESHESMRRDFEITVPPVDALVELIAGVLGDEGGARMTGGGFGGCVVALAPEDRLEAVRDSVARHYRTQTGHQETLYVCTAEQGAFS